MDLASSAVMGPDLVDGGGEEVDVGSLGRGQDSFASFLRLLLFSSVDLAKQIRKKAAVRTEREDIGSEGEGW